MTLPDRPFLVDVLFALASEGDEFVTREYVERACEHPLVLRHKVYARNDSGWHWGPEDADEAWELLATRGVISPEAVDEPRRRFECFNCLGTGIMGEDENGADLIECNICRGPNDVPVDAQDIRLRLGTFASPYFFRDVVSIASAWPSVLVAEELAREAAHVYGERCDVIVWRVGRSLPVSDGRAGRPEIEILLRGFALDSMRDGRVTLLAPLFGGG